MAILAGLARKMLRARSPLAQMGSQVCAGFLSRTMDQVFARAAIDWNGRPSCLLLSFDVDFPEDAQALPGIVEMLRVHPVGASCACVGRWVEDYPDAHRAVIDAGYELFNHSYSHPELVNSPRHFVSFRDDFNPRPWAALDPDEQAGEIRSCQETVERVLGYAMRGFRVPHFGNVDPGGLYPVLEGAGLEYSSSLLAPRCERFGIPVWRGGVLEVPVTACPRHPFTSFDSWHALYARGGWHRDDFFAVLAQRLEQAVQWNGLTNIYLDPKDQERLDFSRIFAFIASLGDACWTPTYAQFADWYRNAFPPPSTGGRP